MPNHIFYEVKNNYGSQFGSESVIEALKFWEQNPGTSLWVSEWEGEGEDLWQTTKGIDLTALLKEREYVR
jgi:hypothetical protein